MSECPNPKRVAAGRLNRMKSKGLTLAGIERLRQAALRNKPWSRSTGPRTLVGKSVSAANGRLRQKGPISLRQLRAEMAEFRTLASEMRATRQALSEGTLS